MGKLRNKDVGNPSTTSELPSSEKKKGKRLKVATKIAKKSSKGNSEISGAVSGAVNTEDSKTVKDIAIKLYGSAQVIEQGETNTKVTETNTKETEMNTKETFGGLIFMCNGKTKPDCFHYKVFGLPENKREVVFRIKPGMRLFLYDIDLKLLHGIFKASSCGAMRLEPEAFNGFYPAQVRFEVERACNPLPLHIFKYAIKDNSTGVRNMFKTELSIEQVNNLVKLFSSLPHQEPIFKKDASAPRPVPAPKLWPSMLPQDGPPPLPREIVQTPISLMPFDRRPLHEQQHAKLGLNPNPIFDPHRNVPHTYTYPYRAAAPYEPKLNYQNDLYQTRLDKAGFSLRPLPSAQPAPHVRSSSYSTPRLSNLMPESSRDARLGEMLPSRAPVSSRYSFTRILDDTLSGYNSKNSLPVSSRYSFAGPSVSYK